MESKNSTNELLYKTESDSQIKNKHGYQRGGKGKLKQESGTNMYTQYYIKTDKQQELTV